MGIYNQILEDVVLPLGDSILGNTFMSHLKKWRQNALLDEQTLEQLQRDRLFDVLFHATKNVPYYKNINLYDSNNIEGQVNNFPILTKKILREQQAELFAVSKKKLIRSSSSGSTGVQSVVFMNKDEVSEIRAIQTLWWEWAGFKFGQPLIQTGITPNRGLVKTIKDFLLRTKYISAFSHDEKEIFELLNNLNGTNDRILAGYASSLYVMAEIAKKCNIKDVQFKTSISWGDKLFAHYRNLIESTFNTKVYETYGAAEGLMIAAQKDLDYLYLMTPSVYLELLDDNGKPVQDGEIGHVVVTSLIAKSFPLIRYKIGDLAIRLPKEEYPENRKLSFPLLKKVVGRETDLVKTRSGKSMVVHSFTGIFEHIPEVKQFRVIQNTFDAIEIEIIPGPNYKPQIASEISEKIIGNLGERIEITYKEVDFIPASPSGKPQMIKSHLS